MSGQAFANMFGFGIMVVPDDDTEALEQFAPEIVAAATQTAVAFKGHSMYVRESLWMKMMPEIEKQMDRS